jgi:putative ABC transport system permease protein
MRARDAIGLAGRALARHPGRTTLVLLAMAMGVAAVVVLTALGEGARQYVRGEFASLGTHLVIVLPGRSETAGGGPAMFGGGTPRDLTVDDAVAIGRHHGVRRFAPVIVGAALASHGGLEREVPVLGSTADLLAVRRWHLASGRFLPPGDPNRDSGGCVIGAKIRRELFGAEPAVGQWLRVGTSRFRVLGVLATEGRSIGMDVQELVIVSVAAAERLFDTPSLFRILVEARSRDAIPHVKRHALAIVRERHQGEEDVTVVTQDAVLATFDRVLRTLTLAVGGIAAVSLGVAGILIMNVMLVSVSQRTPEIGLLKALGAPPGQIRRLFLLEAVALSGVGAMLGLGVGLSANAAIRAVYPVLPLATPLWALGAGLGTALLTGVGFGALPAQRAARLDPVDALAHR